MSSPAMRYLIAFSLAALAGFGGAAIVVGEIDDAPGAMLIGLLLILGAGAIGARTARPTSDL